VRALVQRVARAEVRLADDASVVGAIGRGLLVLVGVAPGDGADEAAWMADKVAHLRVFVDADGKMNRALADVGGGVLLVPQFTLYGDVHGGRRPGFAAAARPEEAEPRYLDLARLLRGHGVPVATGAFGRAMHVASVNDGPVTLWIDTADRQPARAAAGRAAAPSNALTSSMNRRKR
jgi:D-aminoacyl-tRNA deacylase